MQSLETSKVESWLSWFFKGVLIVVALVLFGRMFELQIIKGAYYRDLSESNRIRRVPITAPRGKIFARGGEVLVDNQLVTKVVIFDPENGFEKKLASEDTLQEDRFEEWKRSYPIGEQFAHVSGYINEVNESEVGKVDPQCPDRGPRTLGSFIGRGGLEQYYDCTLRGVDGEELVEVNTFGAKERQIGRKPPQSGSDVHTTIDYKLQKKLSEVMADKVGAAIITDPQGEVLALHSAPSFDPNNFDPKYLTDENLPLFNRAIGGTYHPGSIFKMVSSAAALENKIIDKDFTYNDTGFITAAGGDFTYRNWYHTQYGGVEGSIDLARALARSTDTFFYEIGAKTGIDELVEWSKAFGLGELTNIDMPGEVEGLVPSPAWKKAVKGERWFLGNTYHYSIGQGDLALTPVETHRIAAVIASNGKLCDLRINIGKDENCRNLPISKENIEYIKEGMVGACSPGGTAYPFFDLSPSIACKTGTAETGLDDDTHAWFTFFAPAEEPEIVMTILIEKGGEGSKDAAPIAKEIFDFWNRERNP